VVSPSIIIIIIIIIISLLRQNAAQYAAINWKNKVYVAEAAPARNGSWLFGESKNGDLSDPRSRLTVSHSGSSTTLYSTFSLPAFNVYLPDYAIGADVRLFTRTT